MPAPSGRIFSATKAADPCPIKNAFDPAAHSTAGLRFCFPQWLDDLHHQADIDRRNGQLAEYGIDVHHKRTPPLLAVSSIAPVVFMARHIGFSRLRERLGRCFGCPPVGHGRAPVSDRVNALEPKRPASPRGLTRPGKATGMGATEAHIVQTAVLTATKNPAL